MHCTISLFLEKISERVAMSISLRFLCLKVIWTEIFEAGLRLKLKIRL